MRVSVLCAVFLLVAGSVSGQVELLQTFETTDDFTISLPSGWHEIPNDMLRALTLNLAQRAPAAPRMDFAYGYQVAVPPNWFQYPYTLVQIENSGKIPESELESMSEFEDAMQEGADTVNSAMGSFMSQGELTATRYDPDENIIWTQTSMEVVGIGRVRGITAAILTERGIIAVHSYALDGDFAYYEPMFEEIARGVSVSEYIRYKSQVTASRSGGASASGAASVESIAYSVGFIVGAFVVPIGLIGSLVVVVVWVKERNAS